MCMNMYIYMIIYVFNINLKNEIFFFRGKFLIDYVMPQIQFSKNVLTKFGETPNSLIHRSCDATFLFLFQHNLDLFKRFEE